MNRSQPTIKEMEVVSHIFKRIRDLLELNLQFHHGGCLVGPNHRRQRAKCDHCLGQIRLLPPAIELIDDAKRLAEIFNLGGREIVGVVANHSLGLGEPVASDDAMVSHSSLVVD